MECDPRKINEYTFEELKAILDEGKYTFDDFQNAGLRWQMQEQLMDYQKKIEERKLSEQRAWESTKEKDIVSAYKFYLGNYGDDAPHAFDAKMRISELEQAQEQLYQDLYDDMRENMTYYKANVMQILFGKITATDEMKSMDNAVGRFLGADLKLTFDDLIHNGFIESNNSVLKEALFKDDFEVPQLALDALGDFPTDRTDVYFMGCPASGKSCVLAGFLNYMRKAGLMEYKPQKNGSGRDECQPYYNALILGLSSYKAPRSTGTDTISFLKLDIGEKRDHKVTVMELSGEAFNSLSAAGMNGPEVWNRLGAGRCLRNNNNKVLFFLLDYSSIIGKNPRYSEAQQSQILENALTVFCSDGEGKDGKKGCTMSKVKTVAVIITKSDMMGEGMTPKERSEVAISYLQDKFKNFMENLTKENEKYGINANNTRKRYAPFVMTFSLGKFYLGNSVMFDPTDSKLLGDFIIKATPHRHHGIRDFI